MPEPWAGGRAKGSGLEAADEGDAALAALRHRLPREVGAWIEGDALAMAITKKVNRTML